MKKNIKSISIYMLIVMILSILSVFSISANADVTFKVNGKSVKPGDYVTYTAEVEGLQSTVAAFSALLKYDDTKLGLVSGGKNNPSIIFGEIFGNGVIYNECYKDGILFNAGNGVNGYDFSVKSTNKMITATFKVLENEKSYDTNISLEFNEFFDLDIKSYKEGSDYELIETAEINVYTGDKTLVDKSKPSINAGEAVETPSSNKTDTHDGGKKATFSPTVIFISVIIIILICVIIAIMFVPKKENKNEGKTGKENKEITDNDENNDDGNDVDEDTSEDN